MEIVELPVEARKPGNKRDAGRLRRSGQLTGVVYGSGTPGHALTVDDKELRTRVQKLDGSHLIKLVSAESALNDRTVLIREVQHHPVSHAILHLDFYEVDLTHNITVMVPLNYVGRPAGVVHGGVLQPIAREVEVECLPIDIPGQLDVDVSGLEIGHGLRSEDIVLPPNVSITTPGMPLVSVLAPTVTEVREEEEAAEEAAEAEREGAAPAESKEE